MFVFVVCQYFYVVLCCFYAIALFFQKKNKNILMKTTDYRFAIHAYGTKVRILTRSVFL